MIYAKNRQSHRFLMALSVYFGVIRSAEKVIERYAEVIGKAEQGFIICLELACFVTAYAVFIEYIPFWDNKRYLFHKRCLRTHDDSDAVHI